MQRARNRIRELTVRKRALLPVEEVVQDVNNFLRGWANYYRYGNSRLAFTKIRPTRCSAWFCSWPTCTTAQRGMAGRS